VNGNLSPFYTNDLTSTIKISLHKSIPTDSVTGEHHLLNIVLTACLLSSKDVADEIRRAILIYSKKLILHNDTTQQQQVIKQSSRHTAKNDSVICFLPQNSLFMQHPRKQLIVFTFHSHSITNHTIAKRGMVNMRAGS
jgi:hypothetical protein